MVEIVSIPDLRQQLRIDSSEEDLLLSNLIEAARRAIENRIDGVIFGDAATIKDADIPIARQATLMLAAHWYVNRETSTARTLTTLPLSVEWMITPLAKLGV